MGPISCVPDVALPRDLLWKISCSLEKQETIFLNKGGPEPCEVQGQALHPIGKKGTLLHSNQNRSKRVFTFQFIEWCRGEVSLIR